MNTFLKNLGLILVVIGAIILIVCFLTGNVNENLPLVGSAALIIAGIITHIVLNKRID
ncbi:MAG: hypothetical protein IKJ42_07145 [Bacteroidaceae bacterium]|nr:hypothetical protein [Bacteroidaceae bacterium]MBR3896771.1 hypothetical protein [Bacteroidaceae bacterium]